MNKALNDLWSPPTFTLAVRVWLDNHFLSRWTGRRGQRESPSWSPILLYVTLFFGLGKSGSLPDTTKNSLGIGRKNSTFFFYFADRASQYIYLNINQPDALNFIMSLFHASTCFEHTCLSSGGQNCTIQPLVSSHL